MKTYTAKTKPKLSKSSEAIANAVSPYFGRVHEHWIKSQDEGKRRFDETKKEPTEKGFKMNLHPSAGLYFGMCMEDYFKHEVNRYLEFAPEHLPSIRVGTSFHSGFFDHVRKVPHLLYPFPEFKNDLYLKNWFNKTNPEIPVSSHRLHTYGIVDNIIAMPVPGGKTIPYSTPLTLDNVIGAYEPCVLDLKTTFAGDFIWKQLLLRQQAKPSYIAQVCICIYLINLDPLNYFPGVKITKGCVAYYNFAKKPFSKEQYLECYFDYDDEYEEKTHDLLTSWNYGYKNYISGRRVECTHRWCIKHGDEES